MKGIPDRFRDVRSCRAARCGKTCMEAGRKDTFPGWTAGQGKGYGKEDSVK